MAELSEEVDTTQQEVSITNQIQVKQENMRAIKWNKESTIWEFYIYDCLRGRASEKNKKAEFTCLVLQIESFHLYRESSFLVMPFVFGGTLNDILNLYRGDPIERKKALPDDLAMYYAHIILKAVQLCHQFGIIYGDVKPDNFLVSMGKVVDVLRLPDWRGQIDGGWERFGLKMIDFGNSLDTYLHSGRRFLGPNHADGLLTPAMKKNEPWCFDADVYATGCLLYLLLFGEALDCATSEEAMKKCAVSLHRYSTRDVWIPLFESLFAFDQGEEREVEREQERSVLLLGQCLERIVEHLSVSKRERQLRMAICKLINKKCLGVI